MSGLTGDGNIIKQLKPHWFANCIFKKIHQSTLNMIAASNMNIMTKIVAQSKIECRD